jgi:hypothetical protein
VDDLTEKDTSVKAGSRLSFHAIFLGFLFDPEDGGHVFLPNIS